MVWSGGGIGGKQQVKAHGVNFDFSKTDRQVSNLIFDRFIQ